MKKVALIMPLLSVYMVFMSCGFRPETYTADDKKIEIKDGKTFIIKLKANPTTGFEWAENETISRDFLELVESRYSADKPVRTGSGGWQYFTYKALKSGNTVLSLKYWRNWEPFEVAQLAEFEVKIK